MRHKGAWHPPVAGLAPGLKFRLAGLGSSPLSTVPREALRFCFPLFFIKKESFTRATGLAATYFSVLSPLFPDLPCAAQAAGHFGPWASLALSRCFCLSPSFSVDLSLFLLLIPSSPTPGPARYCRPKSKSSWCFLPSPHYILSPHYMLSSLWEFLFACILIWLSALDLALQGWGLWPVFHPLYSQLLPCKPMPKRSSCIQRGG